jgi:hypothetical protein
VNDTKHFLSAEAYKTLINDNWLFR